MQVQFDNIPTEVKALLFLLWRYRYTPGKAKPDKPPIDPNTGRDISPIDASMPFAQAKALHEKGIGEGIGVISHNDKGIIYIDVDGCIKAGKYSKTALHIMGMFPHAYWEVSPSGTGLRGIFYGVLPKGYGFTTQRVKGGGASSIEVYGAHSHQNHYVTLTGNRVPNTGNADNTLPEYDLSELAEAFLPKRKKTQPAINTTPQPLSLTDKEIERIMLNSQYGDEIKALLDGQNLYRNTEGKNAGQPSASHDHWHLAKHLAFWYNKDPARIKAIFEAHQVLEKNPTHRKKSKHYLDKTIRNAINAQPRVFNPQRMTSSGTGGFFVSSKETAIEQLSNATPEKYVLAYRAVGAWLGTAHIEPLWLSKFAKILKEAVKRSDNKEDDFQNAFEIVRDAARISKSKLQKQFLSHFDLKKAGVDVTTLEQDDLVPDPYSGIKKYLPELDVKEGETLCIQSPLGTGKTIAVAKLIAKLIKANPYAKILYTVPRRTLSKSALNKINIVLKQMGLDNQLMDYENIKETKDTDQREAKGYQTVCVINSLHQVISNPKHFDLVILDESELLFSHLIGNTTKRYRERLFSVFNELVGTAKRVVCLDAYLSDLTVKSLRNAGRTNLRGIVCNVSPWQHIKATMYQDKNRLIERFIDDIKRGSPFVVCTSKKQADILKEIVTKIYPHFDFLKLTSDTSKEESSKTFMSNPNDAAELWRGVITSPSVEAGLSVEVDKFEEVYAFLETQAEGTGNLQGAIQQLGRCRRAKAWHIYSPDKTYNKSIEPLDHIKERATEFAYSLDSTLDSEGRLKLFPVIDTTSPMIQLFGNAQAFDAEQKNHFSRHLWALLEQLGVSIEYIADKPLSDIKALTEGAKDTLLTVHAQKIKDAEPIFSEHDYNEIKSIRDKDENTRLQIERYLLEQQCCINFDELDLDETKAFLEWHDEGRGTSPLKYLDLVQCSPQHVKEYGRLLLLGGAHKTDSQKVHNAKDLLDNRHEVQRQYKGLRIIFNAAGILQECDDGTGKITTQTATVFTNHSLQKNTEFLSFMQKFLQENPNRARLGGEAIPKNVLENPCNFVTKLLKRLGFAYDSARIRSARGGLAGQGGDNLSIKKSRTLPTLSTGQPKIIEKKVSGFSNGYIQEIVTKRQTTGKNWLINDLTKWQVNAVAQLINSLEHQDSCTPLDQHKETAQATANAQLPPHLRILHVLTMLYKQYKNTGLSKDELHHFAEQGLSDLKKEGQNNPLLEPWWLATADFTKDALNSVEVLLHEAQSKICKQYEIEPMF